MEEKETKNKFWKGVLVGVLVTAFSGLAVVGVATGIWTVGRRASESQSTQTAETSGAQLDMNKITPKLQYMEALIDKYFLFDENMTEEEQAKNGTAEDWIYRGYMSSLNDPYSVYYDKDEYTSLNEETSGTYCGIGVQVSQNVYTGIITAVKVFFRTPRLRKPECCREISSIKWKISRLPERICLFSSATTSEVRRERRFI